MQTYSWGVPYLKGLHLTIEGWREGQDKEDFSVKKLHSVPGHHILWDWEAAEWADSPGDLPPTQSGETHPAPDLV